MKTCLSVPDNPNKLLSEFESLELVVDLTEKLLGKLRQRQSELTELLDSLTSPQLAQTLDIAVNGASIRLPPQRPRYAPRGYKYKGEDHQVFDKIDIHKNILRLLLRDYPDKQNAIASALRREGRLRNYMSRDRMSLFPGKDTYWVQKHSVNLGNGWYLDTNLAGERIQKLLRAAVCAVGLAWGKDVVIRLNDTYQHL